MFFLEGSSTLNVFLGSYVPPEHIVTLGLIGLVLALLAMFLPMIEKGYDATIVQISKLARKEEFSFKQLGLACCAFAATIPYKFLAMIGVDLGDGVENAFDSTLQATDAAQAVSDLRDAADAVAALDVGDVAEVAAALGDVASDIWWANERTLARTKKMAANMSTKNLIQAAHLGDVTSGLWSPEGSMSKAKNLAASVSTHLGELAGVSCASHGAPSMWESDGSDSTEFSLSEDSGLPFDGLTPSAERDGKRRSIASSSPSPEDRDTETAWLALTMHSSSQLESSSPSDEAASTDGDKPIQETTLDDQPYPTLGTRMAGRQAGMEWLLRQELGRQVTEDANEEAATRQAVHGEAANDGAAGSEL